MCVGGGGGRSGLQLMGTTSRKANPLECLKHLSSEEIQITEEGSGVE